MKESASGLVRAIAAAAVASGFLLTIVVVAISVGGGESSEPRSGGGQAERQERRGARTPKTYVVKSGDTLTSISNRVGVSVRRIQELNPGIDPQILVSGQKLKLR